MGNIWSWLCNSSNKKASQENEGSYKKTESGIAEKVPTNQTVEDSNSTELEVLQSHDENETPILSENGIRLDLSLNNETVEQGKTDEYLDPNASLSFSIDERLPTFVTVPSPTQVTKQEASVRA